MDCNFEDDKIQTHYVVLQKQSVATLAGIIWHDFRMLS